MVESDWGDWLPRAIEEAEPEGVAVWYLGCNGAALKASDGTTVYVDPYLGTGDPPRTVRMIPVPFGPADVSAADAVLATHEHTDHVHGPSQAPILATTGARFRAPDESIAVAESEGWTDRWDVDEGQFEEVSEGHTFDVGGFTVHVEIAHDPDAEHPVSTWACSRSDRSGGFRTKRRVSGSGRSGTATRTRWSRPPACSRSTGCYRPTGTCGRA
jgi:L-ascorbate 6-phosphate lactonase